MPEREVASHVALLPGGPQARLKHYEWMADKIWRKLVLH